MGLIAIVKMEQTVQILIESIQYNQLNAYPTIIKHALEMMGHCANQLWIIMMDPVLFQIQIIVLQMILESNA